MEKVTVDQIMDLIHTRKMEQVKILEDDEKSLKNMDLMDWGIAAGRQRALEELYREIMYLEYEAIKTAQHHGKEG